MAAPPAKSHAYNTPPVTGGTACTATWDGAGTITETVTAGGAVMARHSGQFLGFLTTALVGWANGNPS